MENSVYFYIKDMALELDDVLWAYRTTFKTHIGMTSFKLIYRKSCHPLLEIEHEIFGR